MISSQEHRGHRAWKRVSRSWQPGQGLALVTFSQASCPAGRWEWWRAGRDPAAPMSNSHGNSKQTGFGQAGHKPSKVPGPGLFHPGVGSTGPEPVRKNHLGSMLPLKVERRGEAGGGLGFLISPGYIPFSEFWGSQSTRLSPQTNHQ